MPLVQLVTENDLELTWRRAVMRQRRTIMRVRERGRTRVFEKLRIVGSLASLRAIVMIPTAKLVSPKCSTRALAPYHVSVTRG